MRNFVEILPVGNKLFYADGRTYRQIDWETWRNQ